MKTKAKIQAGAKTLTVISASKKDESNSENGSDITTNKNIAYVAHSPKQIQTKLTNSMIVLAIASFMPYLWNYACQLYSYVTIISMSKQKEITILDFFNQQCY